MSADLRDDQARRWLLAIYRFDTSIVSRSRCQNGLIKTMDITFCLAEGGSL